MWVIFALLDSDPDSKTGSGSTDPIESGSNPDPDPQPCYKEQFRFIGRLAEKDVFDSVSLMGQCHEIIFSGFFH